LWYLYRFLQCINCIILGFTPSTTLLTSVPIPGIVSTGLVFAFTYMCTHFLHHIHPPTSFPQHLSLPVVPALPPNWTCSTLLFPNFLGEKRENIKKKNMTFLR
jgi:hypothetical protein